MARWRSIGLVCTLAACGSSNSQNDAATKKDGASAPTVGTVDCGTFTPVATVTIVGMAYSPQPLTINEGQVVEFVTTSTHNVTPGHFSADSTIADPGLSVDFSTTACKMFTFAGPYGFHCSVHGFDGTIMVQ
ncbi:MAG TPA: hypothetical protein VMJ10_31160 [Kofleriaceae bacterium]|nr:hypothetical protein [Kofleriaceae bacterium]